jgi:steroid 5-alpha reductase family enzyme
MSNYFINKMDAFLMSIIEMFEDDTFIYQLIICHLFAIYCYISSLLTNNFSQVDRLWPILPSLYSWLYVFFEFALRDDSFESESFIRILILEILITSWSIRLTFNSWRRGYYNGNSEDYRWEHVKKYFRYPQNKFSFQLFNIVFIALFQNWLLYFITLPLWYIQKYNRNDPFNYFDLLLTTLFVIALGCEAMADEQQWNYQRKKYNWLKNKSFEDSEFSENDFKRGFVIHGLWRFSRHPNFFAEMTIWWIIYGFSISSQSRALTIGEYPSLFNSTIIGVILLTILFQGSIKLTEHITSSKYAQYNEYQKSVSKIVPSFLSSFKQNKKD